jgi:hypothetical protein
VKCTEQVEANIYVKKVLIVERVNWLFIWFKTWVWNFDSVSKSVPSVLPKPNKKHGFLRNFRKFYGFIKLMSSKDTNRSSVLNLNGKCLQILSKVTNPGIADSLIDWCRTVIHFILLEWNEATSQPLFLFEMAWSWLSWEAIWFD